MKRLPEITGIKVNGVMVEPCFVLPLKPKPDTDEPQG